MKTKLWIGWLIALLPVSSLACGNGWQTCKQEFDRLVSYRTEAIANAFGDLFGTLPGEIRIKLISKKDPEYARFTAGVAYDPEQRTLVFPQEFILMKTPSPLQFAVYYWPYYQDAYYRRQYPVVEGIDNALWGVYLQEAARVRGLSWPHQDCESVDIGKRLACEMLANGIAEYIKQRPVTMFNTNRLDRILPEDFAGFRKRALRTDREYQEVQRYGGILLIGPLIQEFGVRRTLAYVAQTPFEIEQDDLRGSVLHYQEVARKALVW